MDPEGKLGGVRAAAGVSGCGPQGQKRGDVVRSWGHERTREPPERHGDSDLFFRGAPIPPLHTPPPPFPPHPNLRTEETGKLNCK